MLQQKHQTSAVSDIAIAFPPYHQEVASCEIGIAMWYIELP